MPRTQFANDRTKARHPLTPEDAPTDGIRAAESAGLIYVCDDRPGIRRTGSAKRPRYVDANKRPVADEITLARIKRLAIPPAWNDVWICPNANGHVQATGRDARGRKQYRYHNRWREARDETKYARMITFAKNLPKIRQRLARDLSAQGLPRGKVLATVVKLLETGSILMSGSGKDLMNDDAVRRAYLGY